MGLITDDQRGYYMTFFVVSVALGVIWFKVKSLQPTVITTPEYSEMFQSFVYVYLSALLADSMVSAVSVPYLLVDRGYSPDFIDSLTCFKIASSQVTLIFLDNVQYIGNKIKCVASLICLISSCFFISSSSIELLVVSRILSGIGYSLLLNGFDSWFVHQHASQGFPDEWLSLSTQKLFQMTLAPVLLTGFIGQTVESSAGLSGVIWTSIVIFAVCLYRIIASWKSDIHMPSCAVDAISISNIKSWQTTKKSLFLSGVMSIFEASVLLVTYLTVFQVKSSESFSLLSSTVLSSSLIGSYLFLITSSSSGQSQIAFLLLSSSCIFISYSFIWPVLVLFHAAAGAFYPFTGYLKASYIPSEYRNIMNAISKILIIFLFVFILKAVSGAWARFAIIGILLGIAWLVYSRLFESLIQDSEHLNGNDKK